MNHQTESIAIYSEKPTNFVPQVEVAAAYLQIDNKTLFLQKSGSEKGCWGVPAGKIEKGENPIEAVVRELHEETGIDLPQDVEIRDAGKLYMVKPQVSYVYHMFAIKLPEAPSVTDRKSVV